MTVYNVEVRSTAIILVRAPDVDAAVDRATEMSRRALETAGFTVEGQGGDAFESEPVPDDWVV